MKNDSSNHHRGFALHIDWLTLYGMCSMSSWLMGCAALDASRPLPVGYGLKGECRRTMWFERCYEITAQFERVVKTIAVVCVQPTSSVMCPTTCSVKFANHVLYRKDYYERIVNFLTAFQIGNTHIARLDACADFVTLPNGWTGARLAKELMHGRVIRRGSRKFTICGRSAASFTDADMLRYHDTGVESITFGTHASVSQWQLYNKSLELRESKMNGYMPKEYIARSWQDAGIVNKSDSFMRTLQSDGTDVWRIEVRIKSDCRSLLNKETGCLRQVELYDLHPTAVCDTIKDIFAKWSILYKLGTHPTQYAMTHADTLPRVPLLGAGSIVYYGHASTPRSNLPHSNYIKGVMRTLQDFARERISLMADATDAYVLQDAVKIIECIYSQAKSDERHRYFEQLSHIHMEDIALAINLHAQLDDGMLSYFTYLRMVQHRMNRENQIKPIKIE